MEAKLLLITAHLERKPKSTRSRH